jgi:hypothetical protein
MNVIGSGFGFQPLNSFQPGAAPASAGSAGVSAGSPPAAQMGLLPGLGAGMGMADSDTQAVENNGVDKTTVGVIDA